ncbi:hypothetical protein OAO01_05045 [Oligoflexia bacterium]|nr:hypothetical protein [Oligoflexia bacterium]
MKRKTLNDFPEFVTARDKLSSLQTELHGLKIEIANLEQAPKVNALDQKALSLLDDTLADCPDVGHTELLEKVDVLERAVKLQEKRLAEIQAHCSKEICRAAKPLHTEIVRRCATAIVEATRSFDDERALREELSLGDVKHLADITPMCVPGLGQLNDDYCLARLYLKSCVDGGYITKGEAERLLRG